MGHPGLELPSSKAGPTKSPLRTKSKNLTIEIQDRIARTDVCYQKQTKSSHRGLWTIAEPEEPLPNTCDQQQGAGDVEHGTTNVRKHWSIPCRGTIMILGGIYLPVSLLTKCFQYEPIVRHSMVSIIFTVHTHVSSNLEICVLLQRTHLQRDTL